MPSIEYMKLVIVISSHSEQTDTMYTDKSKRRASCHLPVQGVHGNEAIFIWDKWRHETNSQSVIMYLLQLRQTCTACRDKRLDGRCTVWNDPQPPWLDLMQLLRQSYSRTLAFHQPPARPLHVSTPCLKKTVPTYFLLLVCQIWTEFNENWKDCPRRSP